MAFQVLDANGRIKVSLITSGPTGVAGPTGATGPAGAPGQSIILDAAEGDSFIPGPQGNIGPQGIQGIRGPEGSSFLLREEETIEQMILVPQPLSGIPSSSVLAYRATAQNIPATTETAVSFSNALFDSNTFWAIGNPTRLTIPNGLAGKYIVVGQVKWNLTGSGPFYLRIYKNGATLLAENTYSVTELTAAIQIAAEIELVVGDYIELKIYQNSSSGAENTTGGSAQTYLSMTLAAGVISGGSGGGGVVTGALSISAPATISTPVNLTTLGTVDWFAPTNNTTALQLQPVGYPHRKLLGIHFYDYWWIWGPNGITVTTGVIGVGLTMTNADDATNNGQTNFTTATFCFTGVGGATGYGWAFRVRATQDQRVLKIGIRVFSAIITVNATLSDNSASPVSNTYDSGAATGAEREFTITYNCSKAADVYLIVTCTVTTNRGSNPHTGLIYGYMT